VVVRGVLEQQANVKVDWEQIERLGVPGLDEIA
jgi:hypothetical protein